MNVYVGNTAISDGAFDPSTFTLCADYPYGLYAQPHTLLKLREGAEPSFALNQGF